MEGVGGGQGEARNTKPKKPPPTVSTFVSLGACVLYEKPSRLGAKDVKRESHLYSLTLTPAPLEIARNPRSNTDFRGGEE